MSASRVPVLLVLAPALALAQAAAPSSLTREERRSAALPETYEVQRGDTLWDLSAKFLESPWYWPKIWSYNPQVADPHWIYPGNVLRFSRPSDAAPQAAEVPAEDEGPSPQPRELEAVSRADLSQPQQIGEDDDVVVAGTRRIRYVPPGGFRARRDSFVTQREVEDSGRITAAFEEKLLLSIQDRAYARFADPAKVKTGQSYVIYKTDRAVRHPVSGGLFGFKSTIIGSAKVVSVDAGVATIEIVQAFEPIERGALIGTWPRPSAKQVQQRANDRQLAGFIVAAQQDLVSEIGEHHVVFVDKGQADGVQEGNVLTVVRSGDPYGRDTSDVVRGVRAAPTGTARLPTEDVGTLLVVDAQQTSSAALVVRSVRELYVGDMVEMRAEDSATR